MTQFKSFEALKESIQAEKYSVELSSELVLLVTKAYTLGFQDGKASCSSAAYGSSGEDLT